MATNKTITEKYIYQLFISKDC